MKTIAALLFAMCLSLPAAIRSETAVPDLDQILMRHFQARGGLETIRGLGGYRASGTFEMGGARARYVMQAKRPGRLRMDFTLSGVTGVQAIDGDAGWQVMPFNGITEPTPMTAEETRNFKDQADLDGPLVDWRAKGHRVQSLGSDVVDGDPAWRLRVRMASGAQGMVWIDAATFLERRWDVSTSQDGRPMKISIHFGDYRKVGGLLLPHRIEQQVHGLAVAQLFTVEQYDLDAVIDDAVFRMPASASVQAADAGHPGDGR